jgi:hypothetical protein
MAGLRYGSQSGGSVGSVRGGVLKASMQGDKEMKAKLRAIASDKGMRKEARKALKEVGGRMLEVMKDRTPVKTGRLVESLRTWVMISAKKEDMRISFLAGGASYNIFYARKVHEDLKAHHNNGGQAKFMESVINENASTAAAEIAGIIDMAAAVHG